MSTTYPSIGSISSGTMRPEDLIPTFMEALDDCLEKSTFQPGADEPYRVKYYGILQDRLGELERRIEAEGYYESEQPDEDLAWLFEKLDEYAAPYTTFGAHEGDGACYGFWPAMAELEELARYDESDVVKVNAGDEWPVLAEGVEYVMEVTDHGNVTLYDRNHVELWSCV